MARKEDHIISLGVISKILIPFIQLYSYYVLAHGDLGPGGGFQGGVILGSSIILYVLAFGEEEGRKLVSEKFNDLFSSVGVLVYAGVGILCLIAGGAYLEYSKFPLDHHLAHHLGMYGVEIGVQITVSAVMTTLFFETARKEDDTIEPKKKKMEPSNLKSS